MQATLSVATPGIGCFDVGEGDLLVAAADGASWLCGCGTGTVQALAMTDLAAARTSVAASAIEGAIVAGLTARSAARPETPYTLARYVRWLAGNAVFAARTPAIFRRAAERFESTARVDHAAFARRKAREESGHAALARRDLAALGLDPGLAIALVAPPSAKRFAARFRAYVESDMPVAGFGFSYCLERMALGRDARFLESVKALCPPQAQAIRFLEVHSGTGSDAGHVEEQLAFFDSLDRDELAVAVRAARETAALLAEQSLMDRDVSDDEVERRLARAGFVLAGDSRRAATFVEQ